MICRLLALCMYSAPTCSTDHSTEQVGDRTFGVGLELFSGRPSSQIYEIYRCPTLHSIAVISITVKNSLGRRRFIPPDNSPGHFITEEGPGKNVRQGPDGGS